MQLIDQSTQNQDSRQQKLALWGLLLVSVAPSVSVITGFALKAGIVAIVVFLLTKIWIFGLPAFWHLKVEKGKLSFSLPKNGGWKESVLLGLGMLIVIFTAYFILGDKMLKPEELTEILDSVGLTVAWKFTLAILFWVFINCIICLCYSRCNFFNFFKKRNNPRTSSICFT